MNSTDAGKSVSGAIRSYEINKANKALNLNSFRFPTVRSLLTAIAVSIIRINSSLKDVQKYDFELQSNLELE